MGMKYLEELKDTLCEELEKLGKGNELKSGELELIDKLTHSIKNIDKIIEGYEGGHSSAGDWSAMGTYDRGDSYARRRRDSMGRYSRESGYSRRGYSRDDGKEQMIEKLDRMMDEAPDDKSREAIRKAMTAVENA